jgi:hypothetical protein
MEYEVIEKYFLPIVDINIIIEKPKSNEGLGYFASSPDLKGLLVWEKTISAVKREVPSVAILLLDVKRRVAAGEDFLLKTNHQGSSND